MNESNEFKSVALGPLQRVLARATASKIILPASCGAATLGVRVVAREIKKTPVVTAACCPQHLRIEVVQ